MDEKLVMRIAKFYDDTRAWRGELKLAGYRVEAQVVDYNDDQILNVWEEHNGWYVHIHRKSGFFAATYTRADFAKYPFETAEEIMDFISGKLRDG